MSEQNQALYVSRDYRCHNHVYYVFKKKAAANFYGPGSVLAYTQSLNHHVISSDPSGPSPTCHTKPNPLWGKTATAAAQTRAT